MCLAIPGQILEVIGAAESRSARVNFGGIARQVHLLFVPEAQVGDFVMVHVGFAISVVDAEEAERTYEVLQALELLDDGPKLVPSEKP
jgi:hydrogenase expression/formation protein HypC